MREKEKVIYLLKLLLELAILILLILVIIYLVKSKNGVISSITEGNAKEKLDTAIKTFTSTEGIELEQVLRSIEGLDKLDINEETGEYLIHIDGEEFFVLSREILEEPKK